MIRQFGKFISTVFRDFNKGLTRHALQQTTPFVLILRKIGKS